VVKKSRRGIRKFKNNAALENHLGARPGLHESGVRGGGLRETEHVGNLVEPADGRMRVTNGVVGGEVVQTKG